MSNPSQPPQNPCAWLPQHQPKLPKTLLPLQQAGPTPGSWTETSKPSLPFRHSAVTTDALPPSSGPFPAPPPVPRSQQCHRDVVLHPRELQAPLHPITAAVNSTKGPPEGSVPPEHPGRCWQPAVAPAQGTQLSFKALQVPHLRCEPLKSFILLFLFFFFFWTRKWQINFKF